jgi:hypothetical protein
MAKERSLAKAGRYREARDCVTGLEVGIEYDFDNRKYAARLKRAIQFRDCRRSIRYLPEDGHENHTIKVILRELTIAERGLHELHVRATGRLRLGPGSGEHSRLNIKRDNVTARADTLCQWHRQSPRPAPGVQDSHAIG